MASLESGSCLSRDISAIVIGAGPAGLVTALGLSKLCREVHLVEKHPTFEQRGSTFGIMPDGREALEEIDPTLWGDLKQVGIATPNGGLMIPWWGIRDVVLRKVQQTAKIILRAGETLLNIDDDGSEGVRASFESGMELSADFLVGSDGVHSFVRNWLGLPPAIETNSTVFRSSLIVTHESSKDLKALLDLGLVPMVTREFEGMLELSADFLVGSDGVHSFARNWLGLPPAIETNSTVFRGSLIVTHESSKKLKALLDLRRYSCDSRWTEGRSRTSYSNWGRGSCLPPDRWSRRKRSL
jgi:2-polyprenyl-6-methoxyphenol hydroxylase-like FAD-dependent oxidoreductase